ncbi:nitroreductase family protein [bacterium]|nr:nitroreductase family protein [bacterium]
MNKVVEVIKSRRSVRKYIDKEIPREILEDIVDCGRLAPSGYNKQPWVFVVVVDKEMKEKVANATTSGKFISSAGACIAVFCEKDAETGLEDACAATENMIISAQSYGLGTCWINVYKKSQSQKIKEVLNCPDNMELMTLISVGYPMEENRQVPKKSLEEVLKWNSF